MAIKTCVLQTQARCLPSVNWTNRNVKRAKNDPARNSAREQIREEDSESSHSDDSCSDESIVDEYDYRPLAYKQKHKGNPFLKYIGRTFKDTGDDEGDIIEGTVTEIVMESVNKNVCFQYFEENNDEPQYIVAKFAVDNCIWNSDTSNTSTTTMTKKSNFKGWALLADGEQTRVPFLDQAIEVSGKRSRKQSSKHT